MQVEVFDNSAIRLTYGKAPGGAYGKQASNQKLPLVSLPWHVVPAPGRLRSSCHSLPRCGGSRGAAAGWGGHERVSKGVAAPSTVSQLTGWAWLPRRCST